MRKDASGRQQKGGWLLFCTAYAAYTLTYVARLNLSMSKPALSELGVLDLRQLALLGSAFSIVYAAGRLINGIIGDRVQPWVMVSIGLAGAGGANLLFGAFPPFWGLVLFWCVNAWCQSMLWSSLLRCLTAAYPPERIKKMCSLLVTSVAAGNVVGILAASGILQILSVRWAFLLPGAVMLGMSAAAALVLRRVRCRRETSRETGGQGAGPILKAALLLAFPAMVQAAVKDNISLFMADYFLRRFAVDPTVNPLYVLFIPLVGVAGRSLYPVIAARFGNNELKTSAVLFVGLAAFSVPLCVISRSASAATVCLSLLYAVSSMINTAFISVYPVRFTKENHVASVSGALDFTAYAGHALAAAVYGVTVERFGYGSMYVSWVILSLLACAYMIFVTVRDGKRAKV